MPRAYGFESLHPPETLSRAHLCPARFVLGEGTPSSQPQSASLTAPSQGHTPSASLSGGGSAASTSSKSRSRSTTAADAAIVAALRTQPIHRAGYFRCCHRLTGPQYTKFLQEKCRNTLHKGKVCVYLLYEKEYDIGNGCEVG